jgi:energy-converting hydrogenase Eha subunit G
MEQVKRTGPPIFRTAPILIKMSLFIPVGLAVCFSVGPILSSTLIYIEIRNVRASPYVSEYDYRWEKIAGIVVGIISIGLGIAGIVAVATVSYSREEIYYWLDGVVMCNLQILVSHNVRQPA